MDRDRAAETGVVGEFPRDAGSRLGDGVEVAGEGGGHVKDTSWASCLYHEQNGDARDMKLLKGIWIWGKKIVFI